MDSQKRSYDVTPRRNHIVFGILYETIENDLPKYFTHFFKNWNQIILCRFYFQLKNLSLNGKFRNERDSHEFLTRAPFSAFHWLHSVHALKAHYGKLVLQACFSGKFGAWIQPLSESDSARTESLLSVTAAGIFENLYTRDSLQREARASKCSLQRAREGTSPYPTCCYARHMMRAVSDVMWIIVCVCWKIYPIKYIVKKCMRE